MPFWLVNPVPQTACLVCAKNKAVSLGRPGHKGLAGEFVELLAGNGDFLDSTRTRVQG